MTKKNAKPLRCSIDRAKLASALSSLCHFIRHDDDGPVIAECVHLIAEAGRLHLSAASVDMSGATTLNATIDDEGECVVPAVAFRDAVVGCQGARVTLAHVVEGAVHSMHITGDFARVDLMAPEPKDTPDVPDVDVSLLRPVEDGFRDLLRSTVYAASEDEDRPHLCGVHLEARGRSFRATATDGHRLARLDAPASLFAEEWSLILPTAACKALLRIPGDVTGVGRIAKTGRFVAVVGGLTMTSRPVDAAFPPADQVIPDNKNRVVIDRADLLAVTKAATKIASKASGVILSANEDQLRLTSKNPELGNGSWDLSVRVVERMTPQPWATAISPKFLAQLLAAMTAERVTLAFGMGTLDPLMVTDGSGRISVVMPMRADEDAMAGTTPTKDAA